MAKDDQRMHGGDTPGLVPGRGHERHEEPVRLGDREPGETDMAMTDTDAEEPGSTRDRSQESALGGDVATRSSTAPTPPNERDD